MEELEFLRTTDGHLLKLNLQMPCDVSQQNSTPNRNISQLKLPYIHQKTCPKMFTAALFNIAQSRRGTNCPARVEWINFIFTQTNTINSENQHTNHPHGMEKSHT